MRYPSSRTRLDARGRLHLLPVYSKVQREGRLLLPGYPLHPRWYVWLNHIRGCLECMGAAFEDEVCDEGLEKLNAFYAATACRWETRPDRDLNAAFWHRAQGQPGLV